MTSCINGVMHQYHEVVCRVLLPSSLCLASGVLCGGPSLLLGECQQVMGPSPWTLDIMMGRTGRICKTSHRPSLSDPTASASSSPLVRGTANQIQRRAHDQTCSMPQPMAAQIGRSTEWQEYRVAGVPSCRSTERLIDKGQRSSTAQRMVRLLHQAERESKIIAAICSGYCACRS